MKPACAGIEPVHNGLELGRHAEIVQRRHQHYQVGFQHLGHQAGFDGIAEDAGAVHAAFVTSPAGVSVLIGSIEGKDNNDITKIKK